jgi:hypothetical protein
VGAEIVRQDSYGTPALSISKYHYYGDYGLFWPGSFILGCAIVYFSEVIFFSQVAVNISQCAINFYLTG